MELSSHLLNEMMMRATEHAELVRETQAAVNDAKVTEESDDGLVKATVGASGQVLDLELDPRIYRATDSGALAKTILDTIRGGAAKAQQNAMAACEQLYPGAEDDDDFDVSFGPALRELNQLASGTALDRLWDRRPR